MAYDVARVRGLHPSLGDGWVHFDAQNGMLLPDSVATTVSTAFRGSMTTTAGPHPSAQRSAAVLDAARHAVADLVNADPSGVILGADRAVLLKSFADASSAGSVSAMKWSSPDLTTRQTSHRGCAQRIAMAPR